jgi:hypothetical protein
MELPIYKVSTHKVKLESDKTKEAEFTPFTMGQQKSVLTIRETDDNQLHKFKAVVEMVQGSLKNLNVYDLYILDFVKLFYAIRSISESSNVEFTIECECKHSNELTVSLKDDFDYVNNEVENYNTRIKITDDWAFDMRSIKVKDICSLKINTDLKDMSGYMFECIYACLNKVVNKEEIFYNVNDYPDETNTFNHKESMKFIDSLDVKYGKKISDFLEKMPQLKLVKEIKCEKCGKELNVGTGGGIDDFLF